MIVFRRKDRAQLDAVDALLVRLAIRVAEMSRRLEALEGKR